MTRPAHSERLRRNAESKANAERDREPWEGEELEWLQSWDGTEEYLLELAELLGRTIEACRERFYKSRRSGWTRTTTVTVTHTESYRGWKEVDGDGW